MHINDFFSKYDKVVVAVSGGVDSAALLHMALKHAISVKAVFVKSVFQPAFELEDAQKICNELGIRLDVLDIDVLSNADIAENPVGRCYYCKKAIFSRINDYASQLDGYTVIEGTNASDDVVERAGYKALGELGIMSPLRLCCYTKDMVREYAKSNNLFVHSKPSYACLATRVPSGTRITYDVLNKTEMAENELFKLGFTDFRVRYYNGDAVLSLTSRDHQKLYECRDKVLDALKPYYKNIFLDLKER